MRLDGGRLRSDWARWQMRWLIGFCTEEVPRIVAGRGGGRGGGHGNTTREYRAGRISQGGFWTAGLV